MILMALMACTGKETRAVLDDAASYISARPDSALAVLKSIDTDAVNCRRINAQYALLYSMALDKNAIDETNDSLITIATDWYHRHGSADDRLKAFYYHGRVRQNAGDNEGAMEQFVRAESYTEAARDEYAKGLLYNAMGNVYMEIFETDRAYDSFILARDCYFRVGDTDKYTGTLLHLVRYYIARDNYDDAANLLSDVMCLWSEISMYTKSLYYYQAINLNKRFCRYDDPHADC